MDLSGLSDENVLGWTTENGSDTEMNQMVGCLLIFASASGCTSSGTSPQISRASNEVTGIVGASSLGRGDSSVKPRCSKVPKPVQLYGNTSARGQSLKEGAGEESRDCAQTISQSTSPIAAFESNSAAQGSIRNDLVDVEVPSDKLRLAEDSDIRLQLRARGLTSVRISQSQHGVNTLLYFDVPESYSTAPLIYQADGSAVIHVIPLRLGEVWFVIRGSFPNGDFFVKRVKVEVEPPARAPLEVFAAEAAGQNSTHRILLYLQNQPGQKFLRVHAIYDGVKEPIPIDARAVMYKVRTNDDPTPVELDQATGLLKPIHVGHAIVESTFAGQETLTCVVVDQRFDQMTAVGERSNCEELLHPGEKLTRLK